MTKATTTVIGLGDNDAQFNVYIGNRPAFDFKTSDDKAHPVSQGEIYACGQACGNGWRKVFNVYAKLVFAYASENLGTSDYNCWQDYRDQKLLQLNSGTSLMFTAPDFTASNLSTPNLNEPLLNEHDSGKPHTSDSGIAHSVPPAVHIIMGRTYANSLKLPHYLTWLDNEFAVNREHQIIVCPYFDYRQLSNMKIIRLVELIAELQLKKAIS